MVNRKARTGRNPATGEQIKITAKSVARFCVAKTAKCHFGRQGIGNSLFFRCWVTMEFTLAPPLLIGRRFIQPSLLAILFLIEHSLAVPYGKNSGHRSEALATL